MTREPRRRATGREGPSWSSRGRHAAAPLLVPALPPELAFGTLGRLLPTSEACELRLEGHRIPPAEALVLLENASTVADAELAAGGSAAGARTSQLALESESARTLARAVAHREQDLWRVGLAFAGLGADPPSADRARSRLRGRLEALGFRTRIPRYTAEAALRVEPGRAVDPRPEGFWHRLPTDALAAFFPFVDESVREPGGILAGLLLDDSSPVFLDRWAHASYSWGLFGTTGAGKSFAAALFALRSRWLRPEVELFFLDPLGEYGAWARALGGTVLPLARPETGRLNPLDPDTTSGDRTEKASRVGAMLRALFPSLRDEEGAVLDTAVSRLYADRSGVPTFSDLLGEVERTPGGAGRLSSLLEPFRSGSLRALDGPTTLAWGRSPTVIDFRGISEAHLPFYLTYLLDAVYARLRDRPGPKLLFVDEAHLLARHAATAEFLDRVVRHVRHFETGVVVLSQSPEDFLREESGRSLLRNLGATFLFRLAHLSEAARAFFGLSTAEAEWLTRARLPREAGYSEALLRRGPAHLPLAVLASTAEYELLRRTLEAATTGSPVPAGGPERRVEAEVYEG